MKKVTTTIGIPAYNEEAYIGNTLEVLEKIIESQLVDNLIIVNDGSSDKTLEVCEKYLEKNDSIREKTNIIQHSKNFGKGAAVKSIMKKFLENHSKYLTLLDADMRYIPKGLLQKNINIMSQEADINMIIMNAVGTNLDENEIFKMNYSQYLEYKVPHYLSGQRILTRGTVEKIFLDKKLLKDMKKSKYGIETLLTKKIYNIPNYEDLRVFVCEDGRKSKDEFGDTIVFREEGRHIDIKTMEKQIEAYV